MFCGIKALQIWPYSRASKCWGNSVLQTPALVHFVKALHDPERVDVDFRSMLCVRSRCVCENKMSAISLRKLPITLEP